MYPVLFHWRTFTLYTYGPLIAVAVLAGLWLARRRAPQFGLDPEKVWTVGIYAVLAALAGAKVWFVLAEWEYYSNHPREILSFSTLLSGGVFYGAFLSAALVGVVYSWRHKLNPLAILDLYSPTGALGHAIGRLGCFAAGCCYGKPTRIPWSVTFTNPVAQDLAGTPLGIPLHPTQLYESACEFVIFIFLLWLAKRQRFTGEIFGAYAILYGVTRGTIEFFRDDPGRTVFAGGAFSLMQVVSVILIVLGAWLLLRGRGQTSAA